MSLRGLDAWITRSPYDDKGPECRDCGSAFLGDPPDDLTCDECRVSQCDCCGEMKAGCHRTVAYGMDTNVCPKCGGEEP